MKSMMWPVLLCALLGLIGSVLAYEVTTKSTTSQSPGDVVQQFYDNINEKTFSANRDLFFHQRAHIAVYGRNKGPKSVSVLTAEEYIQWQPTEKQWTHVIDSIETHQLGKTLASVFITGHTETWRTDFAVVFTMTFEGGRWRIMSIVQENWRLE